MAVGGTSGGALRRGGTDRPAGRPDRAFLLADFGMAPPPRTRTRNQTLGGRVQNEFEEDGEEVREGVPDVRIVVETADGELIAEGVTDEGGQYSIAVPEAGTYNVRLDTESLPEGVTIPEGETEVYEAVDIRGQQQHHPGVLPRRRLAPSARASGASSCQTLANGFKLAMIIAITSVGLSLIFGTTGLSNFAHGEMVTLGALVAWGFNRSWASWTLIVAAIVGDRRHGDRRRAVRARACGARCATAVRA